VSWGSKTRASADGNCCLKSTKARPPHSFGEMLVIRLIFNSDFVKKKYNRLLDSFSNIPKRPRVKVIQITKRRGSYPESSLDEVDHNVEVGYRQHRKHRNKYTKEGRNSIHSGACKTYKINILNFLVTI